MTVALAAYPAVAVAGALVGVGVHEASHAAVAVAVGELEAVGWQGGLTGGPFVEFRAPTRWHSETIRKAPLALGVVALVAVVVSYSGPTLWWVGLAAAALALLWTSPEDLSMRAAVASAER